MVRKVKTFEWECDYCHKKMLSTGQYESDSRPPGWRVIQIHNCGMTNYTRDDDACPNCYKKHKDDK